jgi:hypothetical protein
MSAFPFSGYHMYSINDAWRAESVDLVSRLPLFFCFKISEDGYEDASKNTLLTNEMKCNKSLDLSCEYILSLSIQKRSTPDKLDR